MGKAVDGTTDFSVFTDFNKWDIWCFYDVLACKPTSGSLWAEQNVILSSRGKIMGERHLQ